VTSPASPPVAASLLAFRARVEVGLVMTAGLSLWAAEALAAGFDGPSLRVLAGLWHDEDLPAAARHLDLAAREVGVTIPTAGELHCVYAREVASNVLSDRQTSAEGARAL
jgi:hypothetical protein